jgi:hypothetical protein
MQVCIFCISHQICGMFEALNVLGEKKKKENSPGVELSKLAKHSVIPNRWHYSVFPSHASVCIR